MSMTIDSITSTNVGAVTSHRRERKEPSLDKTAEALGLNSDQLKTQLKSGKTLDDVASAQGVSSDDLLTALKTDLKASKPADAPELSDDQLTEMAAGIAAGTGPAGPHGAGGPGGPPPRRNGGDDDSSKAQANLASLAETLGLSQSELLDQLTSGSNFSSKIGAATSNPYTSSSYNVSGGVVVDRYA